MTITTKNTSLVTGGGSNKKGPGVPCDTYQSQINEWKRNRAVIQGPSYTKDYDTVPTSDNLLLPFNPTMTQEQYDFYKAEAEVPGVSSEFVKMIIGGLLRKQPLLELPESVPAEAKDWILNDIGSGNESLISFLSSALWEELQTSRAWIQIDYPVVDLNNLTPEQRKKVKPYPIIHNAENVINWSSSADAITGEVKLDMLVTRYFTSKYNPDSPLHPIYEDTVDVHRLDENGLYVIDTYTKNTSATPSYIDGGVNYNFSEGGDNDFELTGTNTNLFINGKRMDFIPFYPFNGSVELLDPIMTPIVNREISLYNKISRRNHLLYLSATYTPVVKSDSLTEQEKDQLVRQGLGTWLFVNKEDSIETLETPTAALKDMESAIKGAYDELTRIGIKMLSLEPNNSDQSGVALQIRNAAQNAALSTLNAKVSESMRKIIKHLVMWRYDIQLDDSEIRFNLSSDLTPSPVGADWMRLITEWYQGGLIPRSTFIEIAKNNDVLPTDYDDVTGQDEISQDDNIISPRESFNAEMKAMTQENNTEENN